MLAEDPGERVDLIYCIKTTYYEFWEWLHSEENTPNYVTGHNYFERKVGETRNQRFSDFPLSFPAPSLMKPPDQCSQSQRQAREAGMPLPQSTP